MRCAAAIALIALAPLSHALADVYRSVDAQGHVLYSDTPSPGAQLVHTTGTQHFATTASADASAHPAPKNTAPPYDAKAEQAAAQTVQNDVAQTRSDQCKKAQDAYDKAVQARRIYTVGSDGERNYLSDDEAEKQRINTKLQMDELCKGVQP